MTAPGPGLGARAERRRALLLAVVDEFRQAALLTAQPKQANAAARTVRRFLWTCEVVSPEALSAAAIEAYLARLTSGGRAAKTVLNHRSAISCFCRFLIRRRMLACNPCTDVPSPRPEEQLPRWLDQGEIDQVLALARQRGIWPEVCLALATGLRLSELIRLQWTDVDVGRRCLRVLKSKSHRPRVVPLSRSALAALQEQRRKTDGFRHVFPARTTWPRGWRFVNKHRASNWWRRALRPIQEAVPKFRTVKGTGRGWHLFRHTFASRAAQAGVSLYKLAAWLGHADVRTTRMYAHLQVGFDEEIEAAAPFGAAVEN